MAFLAIRSVKYQGIQYFYQSPRLGNGLNILEGENGTGKSTFANLIYFGLGGRVPSFETGKSSRHKEICGDKQNYVELSVEIDGVQYVFARFFGTTDIGITSGTTVEVLPIFRGTGREYIFSDWLLNKLEIEPVTLQYGTYAGKLNFTDLMRLMYHDQAPDPKSVYKASDTESFVTDSRDFRRAIFEILVGKSFQEYYSALAKYRLKERERGEVSKALELFKEFAGSLPSARDDLNLIFIDERIKEITAQEQRLIEFRASLAKSPPRANAVDFSATQAELLDAQLAITRLTRTESDLLEEISRLENVKADLVLEATQIKKMMFAHENLKLFSANTCPYCLRDVPRVTGKCVCGAEVDEADYERFFYDADEYLAILKSRQKNVETVDAALHSANEELAKCRSQKTEEEARAKRSEEQINRLVGSVDAVINIQQFEDIEKQLGDIRKQLASLQQQRELEQRREELEKTVNRVGNEVHALKTQVDELAIQAEKDIKEKTLKFSEKYSEMLRNTIKDVRIAAIDPDYLPIINQGEYREASADVPRRLLYFSTLLYLSLTEPDIKFPRFLLIDTPETAGIDSENLNNSIRQLMEIVNSPAAKSGCQVILTTGLNKYPSEAKSSVFETLTVANRLLRPQETTTIETTATSN